MPHEGIIYNLIEIKLLCHFWEKGRARLPAVGADGVFLQVNKIYSPQFTVTQALCSLLCASQVLKA